VGNLLSITDQGNSLNSQTFGYDALYRLETAQGAYGNESVEYDGNGNRARYLNNDVDEPYHYEPESNRLESAGRWTFERDAAGNRSAKRDGKVDAQSFNYADHNRLTQASIRNSDGDTVSTDYVYDGRGQRASKTDSETTIHFIYGPSGELLGEYSSGLAESVTEYVYLNGQPIAVINRKTEMYQPPESEKIVDNGDPGTSGNGPWQSKSNRKDYGAGYLFANKALDQSYRWATTPPGMMNDVYAWWVSGKSYSTQVAYTIGYGSGQTDTVIKNQRSGGGQWQFLGTYQLAGGPDYVEARSADNKWVADAIRWVEVLEPVVTVTAATHFIHNDHLGAPRRVTDVAQNVVWSWDSRPFGNSLPDEDPDGDFNDFSLNLRFPGQYFDAESGLHYNYFRTYDPEVGRYSSSDPLGLRDGVNPFSYASNNPVLFFDTYGLYATGEWINQPRFNLIDIGVQDFDIYPGSGSLWGEVELARLYGYVTGFINVDVRCEKSDDCSSESWEIHERIDIFYQGTTEVGPNAYAAAAGRALGIYGWIVANILTTGGSVLTGGLELLKAAERKAGIEIALIYAHGPDALCLASGDK